MKTPIAVLIALASASFLSLADPGTPADSGLAPLTSTFYVTTNLYNIDSSHEHPGVDIAANGNVIFGWENDGDGITDFEAVWTLYDPSGNLLTPPTVQSNRDISGLGALTTVRVGHEHVLVLLPLGQHCHRPLHRMGRLGSQRESLWKRPGSGVYALGNRPGDSRTAGHQC